MRQTFRTNSNNVVVDMIYSAMQHYKRMGRPIKTVLLSQSRWEIFKGWLKEKEPAVDIQDIVEFNDITVKKGHQFMKDNLEVEFKTASHGR